MKAILKYFRSTLPVYRTFYSEVIKLLKLILVMPATNAIRERSFSTLKRVKTYLTTTMTQRRLNHLMLLHVHKDKTDNIDLKEISNDFVCNENRLCLDSFNCWDSINLPVFIAKNFKNHYMKNNGIEENFFSLSRINGRKGHFNGNYMDFFSIPLSKILMEF